MSLPTLTGNLVNLRQYVRSDAERLQMLANDRRVSKWLPMMPYPYQMKDAREWISLTQRMIREGTEVPFAIELAGEKLLAGGIGLRTINRVDRNAEVGMWIARRYWRKGLGGDAMLLMLKYAFDRMRLRRVYATVHEANTGSVRLLEKSGFTREGTWRKASRATGPYRDVYAYGILVEEFRSRK
jgi:RimJ/RimL family protein N-acetyltransferase